MSLVADSSPLIFLRKVGHLNLARRLFRGPFLIPAQVYEEVMRTATMEGEFNQIEEELRHWKIREIKVRIPSSGVVSSADWSVFELARSSRPKIVLADDKYLRGILSAANLLVLGTLGLFNLAVTKKVLSAQKAIEIVDILVEQHQYWIDVSTYTKFIHNLKRG